MSNRTRAIGWLLAVPIRLSRAVGPSKENPIPLSSQLGQELLRTSQHKAGYERLQEAFVQQVNPAYCGVASGVIALNLMRVPGTEPWDQDTWFSRCEGDSLGPEHVLRSGMNLGELAAALTLRGMKSDIGYATAGTVDQFRRLLREELGRIDACLLTNYLREGLGQGKGGHTSPVAAYHQPSDRLLILDVAPAKHPPLWVPTVDLWRAMNTVDPASMLSRGYLLIHRGDQDGGD